MTKDYSSDPPLLGLTHLNEGNQLKFNVQYLFRTQRSEVKLYNKLCAAKLVRYVSVMFPQTSCTNCSIRNFCDNHV